MITFNEIFRSIISIKNKDGNETIPQIDLLENFRSLQKIVPNPPEEKAYHTLYYFIYNYYKDCDSDKLELPSFEYIKNYFTYTDNSEALLITLDKIKMCQPYVGMDYRNILKRYVDHQNVQELSKILNIAQTISDQGFDLVNGKKKTKLKGIPDALSYISRETKKLITGKLNIITEGQIVSEKAMSELDSDYNKAASNPQSAMGINIWLKDIDECTGGLKSGELMIITAFTGHCKTTLSLNQAYRALYAGYNTAFVTLEMSYSEIRDKIMVLHSCNSKFKSMYPKYAHVVGKLSYNNLRYGQFTDEEFDYFEKVKEDFRQPDAEYGRFFVWQPEKTVITLSDIEIKFREFQQDCQVTGRDLEFGVIDYISLLGADTWEKAKDGNETTNNIVKNLKRLCLTFNDGKGIRILSPHQANRDGYREAKGNDGKYDLTALSNNHEIERSADLVISAFKFDDRSALKLCCLKNRRNSFFKPFDAGINFESGFIYDYAKVDYSDIDISKVIG